MPFSFVVVDCVETECMRVVVAVSQRRRLLVARLGSIVVIVLYCYYDTVSCSPPCENVTKIGVKKAGADEESSKEQIHLHPSVSRKVRAMYVTS